MASNSDELRGFRKLYEFSQLLLAGDEPESLLNRLVEATRSIIDADQVFLFQLHDGEPVIQAMATGSSAGPIRDGEPDYSKTLINEVFAQKRPLLLEDVSEDPRFEKAKSIQVLSITSAIGAPLFYDGQMTGIIYAARQRITKNFTEEQRELMTVAASQASLLIGKLATMKALRESESRHRSLVEMSPSTIAVIQGHQLVFASPAAVQLWRAASASDLRRVEIGELFDPWRSQSLLEALRDCESFESIDAWAWRGEGYGDGVPVEVTGRPIQFEGSPAMQLMISEAGQKQTLLARRVRTDRLVVMGTIAATVGHEINNPLSYVYANLDFVVEELKEWWAQGDAALPDRLTRTDVIEGLESAREGTERIRSVVASIQNFSRLDDDEKVTPIQRPLESSLRIARSRLEPDVDVQIDIRPTAPVALCAARLGQVFLNLLINAAQALSEVDVTDGMVKRLEVRTRQENDDQVIVEIADNGPGIAPEVRRHIFEPFVTTKPGEEGTGLGLAICHDIVKSSGGQIEVESEFGRGTLFRIRLPTAAEPATQSIALIPESEGDRSGRVLVVDPELTLARSVRRVLQGRHDVTAVSSKREAVELLSGEIGYDVILCDLRLRGGMGRDLFGWIESHAPQYWDRLVAMTANRITQNTREYLDALPNPWLAKPFDINRLRAIINGLLAADEQDADVG